MDEQNRNHLTSQSVSIHIYDRLLKGSMEDHEIPPKLKFDIYRFFIFLYLVCILADGKDVRT